MARMGITLPSSKTLMNWPFSFFRTAVWSSSSMRTYPCCSWSSICSLIVVMSTLPWLRTGIRTRLIISDFAFNKKAPSGTEGANHTHGVPLIIHTFLALANLSFLRNPFSLGSRSRLARVNQLSPLVSAPLRFAHKRWYLIRPNNLSKNVSGAP